MDSPLGRCLRHSIALHCTSSQVHSDISSHMASVNCWSTKCFVPDRNALSAGQTRRHILQTYLHLKNDFKILNGTNPYLFILGNIKITKSKMPDRTSTKKSSWTISRTIDLTIVSPTFQKANSPKNSPHYRDLLLFSTGLCITCDKTQAYHCKPAIKK